MRRARDVDDAGKPPERIFLDGSDPDRGRHRYAIRRFLIEIIIDNKIDNPYVAV